MDATKSTISIFWRLHMKDALLLVKAIPFQSLRERCESILAKVSFVDLQYFVRVEPPHSPKYITFILGRCIILPILLPIND